jgi:hypothetical protein
VILIANLLMSIDIDQDGHWSLFSLCLPQWGILAFWIELANDVTVQCSQDANPGMLILQPRKTKDRPKAVSHAGRVFRPLEAGLPWRLQFASDPPGFV